MSNFHVIKGAQKLGLILCKVFKQNCLKQEFNQPNGENSPNLVTLLASDFYSILVFCRATTRVARWYIFKRKIIFWVIFRGS
jgi:hypothetical protein